MPLNKKLFSDFKSTPITRKIAFIQNNAEIIIKEGLFKECFNQLEYSGKDLLLKKNGEAKYKEFEIERKKLANLPQEIERKRKSEELKAAEKAAFEAAQMKIKQIELGWQEQLNEFNTEIEFALVADQDIKTEDYRIKFEEVKNSKPKSLEKPKLESYENYIDQLPQYIAYQKIKNEEVIAKLNEKKTRNKWIIGSTAAISLVAVLSWAITALQKKSAGHGLKLMKETHMTYDSNGQLTGVEEKNYQVADLNSAQLQDRLYVINNVKEQSKDFYQSIKNFDPNNKLQIEKSGFYLSALNGLMETLHERDVEGHLFILAELEKIEKNKEKLMTLFIKSDQSFVFSVDPNDLKQAFKNNQTSNESLSERKYQFFHLLVLLYAKSINSLVGKTEYIKDDQYASQLVTSYIFNIRLGLKFKPQSKELQKLFEDIKKKVKSQK